MKTAMNTWTPRKPVAHPIPKPQAKEKAAAQRKERKQTAKARRVGWNNGAAGLDSHGMGHNFMALNIVK